MMQTINSPPLKTLKDIPLSVGGHDDIRQEAITWFLHGCKKRKNPYKMFLDFLNLEEGDLKW